MELAGINERGVRAPIVRIPVKTHLSSVILTNNPWEERELEKKLEQIRQERRRRENTLNWFQRQFFVNQVFDQDDKLRFAGEFLRHHLQRGPQVKSLVARHALLARQVHVIFASDSRM
jgi:hypothetical protein